MKFIVFALAAVLGWGSVRTVQGEQPNQLSPAEEKSGWELLFDGKTTDGWRNYKQEGISDGWVVEDGALVRKGRGAGDIVTDEEYDNFELLLDYRISEAGNSGLMFHVDESEDAPWKTGPEVQIQDNVKGHDPQKAGWLYQLYPAMPDRFTNQVTDSTRPAGEWNQLYLRVTPDNCEIQLNGTFYSSFKKGSDDWNQRVAKSKFKEFPNFGKPTKGHICLQDHNDVVAYRNIKLRKYTPGKEVPNPVDGRLALKPALAFPKLTWAGWEPEDPQGRRQDFRPIVVTAPSDGSNRLFVAEQHGSIWCFDNTPDVTKSHLFLNLNDKVQYSDRANEEGLLGLAFHPKFKENGQFFVYYTLRPGQISIISRLNVSKDDPNKADPASEKVLLRVEQPFWNHNGGTLTFGPDGYLYIGLGDGGAANDPYRNAQNLNTLLGSILRIDVDNPQNGKAYGIPADNPFVGRADAQPEIYAYGLRNMWRMEFDRETGVLWCGDVGQNLWEEIDLIEKGGNYGWNFDEATHPFGSQGGGDARPIDPIWVYDHQVGKSITGGLVYRGRRLPSLRGKYVYADYVTGKIWALTYDPEQKRVVSNEEIPSEKMPIITFGDDADGELYFCIVTPTGKGIYTLISE